MNYWRYMLLNMGIFQLGWAVCILAGNIAAVVYTLIALFIHCRFFIKSQIEVFIIFAFAVLGIAWDSILNNFGVLSFSGAPALVPVWLACLWLLFACTLNHSLAWLKNKLLLASAMGAIAAPLSYLAGIKLGAATTLTPLMASMLVIALGWMLILPLGLYATRWCRHV